MASVNDLRYKAGFPLVGVNSYLNNMVCALPAELFLKIWALNHHFVCNYINPIGCGADFSIFLNVFV